MATASAKEVKNRNAKAFRLAAHLFVSDIHSSDLPKISSELWAALATSVGVNPPKFVDGRSETVEEIDFILRTLEGACARRNEELNKIAFDFKNLRGER